MTIRYAMAGGGPGAMIGRVHRAAAAASGFELVAGSFSSDPVRSHVFAAKSGLSPDMGYDTWSAVMADAAKLELQAAIIVTPNHLHASQARDALRAGLHVFCDKPLCLSSAEAATLVAEARGRVFGVTYNYFGYVALQHAAALVADGWIGNLRLFIAEFLHDWLTTEPEAARSNSVNWRMDPARSGPVGVTSDLGTHIFHLAQAITGQAPHALSADLSSMVEGRQLEDTSLVRLRYPTGARGVLTISQAAVSGGSSIKMQILGDIGGIAWSMDEPHVLKLMKRGEMVDKIIVPNSETVPETPGWPKGFLNAFAAIYRRFAEAMAGERVSYPSILDGARGVLFIEAVLASSRQNGAWVPL